MSVCAVQIFTLNPDSVIDKENLFKTLIKEPMILMNYFISDYLTSLLCFPHVTATML